MIIAFAFESYGRIYETGSYLVTNGDEYAIVQGKVLMSRNDIYNMLRFGSRYMLYNPFQYIDGVDINGSFFMSRLGDRIYLWFDGRGCIIPYDDGQYGLSANLSCGTYIDYNNFVRRMILTVV